MGRIGVLAALLLLLAFGIGSNSAAAPEAHAPSVSVRMDPLGDGRSAADIERLTVATGGGGELVVEVKLADRAELAASELVTSHLYWGQSRYVAIGQWGAGPADILNYPPGQNGVRLGPLAGAAVRAGVFRVETTLSALEQVAGEAVGASLEVGATSCCPGDSTLPRLVHPVAPHVHVAYGVESGRGSVILASSEGECLSRCSFNVQRGSLVTLLASPADGFAFSRSSARSPECTFAVPGDSSALAVFTKPPAISPVISRAFDVGAGWIAFGYLQVGPVPVGATVELRCIRKCALAETRRARARYVSSRWFLGRRLVRGTVLRVSVEKEGWIGYEGRVEVLAGRIRITRFCTLPGGIVRTGRC